MATQTQIARKTGLSQAFISMIFNGKKKVTYWPTAKKLAKATNTNPILWVEGSSEYIKKVVLSLKC
jgi:transcriptional regulator with XRE-family HTH domain